MSLKYIFIFAFVLNLKAFSQIQYSKFGFERSLPSSSVYGICEDTEGRIWVGTDNGLAYFSNGYFIPFQHDELPSQIIRIYAAQDSGIYLVGNNPSGIFKVYFNKALKKIPITEISRFSGELIDYSAELSCFYYSDWFNVYKVSDCCIDTINKIDSMEIRSLHIGVDGRLIISYRNTIQKQLSNRLETVFHGKVHSCIDLDTNHFLILSGQGIIELKNSKTVGHYTFESGHTVDPINSVYYNKELWFTGTVNGLFQLKKGIINDISKVLSMNSIQFTNIFFDSQKNTWLSTNGEGIILIPYFKNTKYFNSANGLLDNNVSSVSHIGKSTYISTNTGLHYVDSLNQISRIECTYKDSFFPPAYINGIVQIKDQIILSLGFSKYKTPALFKTEIGTVIRGTAISTNDNNLVYSRYRGFGEITYDEIISGKQLMYEYSLAKIVLGRVTDIETVDSGYFLSTYNGLFFCDKIEKRVTKIENDQYKNESFLNIAQTSNHDLMVLSDHSLSKMVNGKIAMVYNKKILHSQIFTCMTIDAFDQIWIGTEHGLFCIKDSIITKFTDLNGLSSNKIKALDFKHADSTLWISTNRGVTVREVSSENLSSKFDYDISIDSLKLADRSVLYPDSLITLNHTNNSPIILFSLKNYFGYPIPEYRYRITGEGSRWVYLDQPEIMFNALSPGKYDLIIQVRAPGFSWSESKDITLEISAPYWAKWEFYCIILLIIIFLLLIVYKMRLVQLKKKEAEEIKNLKRIGRLELEALNSQMNPHFIFNALNAIQHYLIPFKNAKAVEYVANLSKLIRLNMKALGKKRVSLESELYRVKLYLQLEQERYEKELELHIQIDLQTNVHKIWLPPMVIQPIIENSIWHGIVPGRLDGKINLSIVQEGNRLFIKIEDNGIGLSAAKLNKRVNHQSKGMGLIVERLLLDQPENTFKIYEIFNNNSKSKGTCVELKVDCRIID